MESCPLCPCLLKSPDCKCLMLLHVDDILVVCSQSFLDDHLLKALRTRYKVSAEAIRNVGDSITFLKRRIVLENVLKLVLYPHPKHFDELFELMGVKKHGNPSTPRLMRKCWKWCRVLNLELSSRAPIEVQLEFFSISFVTWCSASG